MTAKSKTDRDLMEETLQRMVRTETRLMSLGTKMGFELKDDDDIRVVVESQSVYLASLDVPYTSVIKVARQAGLHGKTVQVWYGGKLVGDLRV